MAIAYRQYTGMEVLSCTDPFKFKPHIHDRYVVWLNTGCGEHFSVQGNTGILQPGSISIFEPGLVHANHPCSAKDRHLRSFYLNPDFIRDLARQSHGIRSFDFIKTPVKDPDLWERLARLHQDLVYDPDHPLLPSRVIETFVLLITRHNISGKGRDAGKTDRSDNRVKKAIAYFHAHLDREIRLNEVAGILGCTQYHLIRLFREHKGLSPHKFLLQMRLEHARSLLEKGSPIAYAAIESGFSDQSHLTRAFKIRYGISPGAYRTTR